MSAIVCGKRSVFEELNAANHQTKNNNNNKRIRFSSSPIRYSTIFIEKLSAIFPRMDKQLLEKALEECGDDLDSAIRSLNELRLGSGSAAGISGVILEENVQVQQQGVATSNGEPASNEDLSAPDNISMNGADWVELFVSEIMSASNIDDAKARASRALEALEKSICARASAEASQSFQQENISLKEQVQALVQENAILKRAVALQHEHQKEFEDRGQEVQQLKQLVSQYQEQLRNLEVELTFVHQISEAISGVPIVSPTNTHKLIG